jgi:hypothetical protein
MNVVHESEHRIQHVKESNTKIVGGLKKMGAEL